MKMNLVGLVVVLGVGAAAGFAGSRWLAADTASVQAPKKAVVAADKVVPVEIAEVVHVALPQGVSAVGNLRSENSVMLRPEVTGRITEINFNEGGRVKKGQVLIRLDESVDKAQLQQAQANLGLVSSQHRRAITLSKQGFLSKQALDDAYSQLKVQQAAVALAQARLAKTTILAPFDGLAGLRNVSVGDYVSPGSDLVALESIDPLKVDFRIPEQFMGQVHEGLKLSVTFDALPGQARDGVVGAISPLVDVGGRSILLRAEIGNADGFLRPGLFARVQLLFSDGKALVVPETALIPSGDSKSVYKVMQGRVQRVTVRTGQRRGGNVEILEGLQAGDQVVVAGLQKIGDGSAVSILDSGPRSNVSSTSSINSSPLRASSSDSGPNSRSGHS